MKRLLSKQTNQVISHLRAREATNRPPKGPVGVLLKEGVLLLNTIPAICKNNYVQSSNDLSFQLS
jgi:hypothetical protein